MIFKEFASENLGLAKKIATLRFSQDSKGNKIISIRFFKRGVNSYLKGRTRVSDSICLCTIVCRNFANIFKDLKAYVKAKEVKWI